MVWLTVVITLVWVANLVASVAVRSYKPDASIDTVFMVFVGALAAGMQLDKIRNQRPEPPAPPKPPVVPPLPPPDGSTAHELGE
jgi:hypothetical protein